MLWFESLLVLEGGMGLTSRKESCRWIPGVTLTNIKRRAVVAALSSLLWVPTEDLVVPVKMRTSPADTQSE